MSHSTLPTTVMECTLLKSADAMKLRGPANMLQGSPAIQRDHDKLEERANKNLVKLNKNKYKILQLGRKSPWWQYRLGTD